MRLDDYFQKTKGFPSVQVINLEEHPHRKQYMIDQFRKYGLNYKIHTSKRFVDFKDKVDVEVISHDGYMSYTQIGIIINFVNAMKDWYYNTSESHVVICDDDISFESIEYWNFTWEQFFNRIPPCDLFQLIRIPFVVDPETVNHLHLKVRYGRVWGSSFLFSREYVKHLLDLLHPSENVYKIVSENGTYEPCIENCLAYNYGKCINFPLLFENNFDFQPGDGKHDGYDCYKLISQYIVRHWWRTHGKHLTLDEALTFP